MFELLKTEGKARRGEFTCAHGTVQTPAFMNVATAAAIKGGISAFDLKADGVDYLRDGAHEESFMRDFPYRKFLYSGVESGVGGLLGFNCGGDSRHIIPVFGHTFNKDTWASDAESAYFQVGSGLCYMPSRSSPARRRSSCENIRRPGSSATNHTIQSTHPTLPRSSRSTKMKLRRFRILLSAEGSANTSTLIWTSPYRRHWN